MCPIDGEKFDDLAALKSHYAQAHLQGSDRQDHGQEGSPWDTLSIT